jgi:hypothetical protein
MSKCGELKIDNVCSTQPGRKKVECTEDNDECWLTTGVPKHGPWF